jgi:formyltetrahydrofolate deformylase
MTQSFTLTIACADQVGIVYAVTGFLKAQNGNITDSAQFNEADSGRFFMRVAFDALNPTSLGVLKAAFAPVAAAFNMDWALYDRAQPTRVMILVSKFDHCLRDLLYRHSMGELPIDIVAIVSNHRDCYQIAAQHDVPFHHLPVTADTKAAQEAKLLALIDEYDVGLVVLARYMQVLSDGLCRSLAGRVINIHHSFLPSFKGAKPYHQAHARGVKVVGATAHFATADLDEGPIIEQGVVQVNHAYAAEELVALGRDIERLVLARAVRNFAEHRVLLNGIKTVVFGR